MKYVDIRDLPPCSFSPQCLRLIDDLDMPTAIPTPTRLAYIEDLQDERHLRQLRSHMLGCPTCSALLAEARRMRTQQRMMLYHFMVANERRTPTTSGAIFEAIRREKVEEEISASHELNGQMQSGRHVLISRHISPTSSPIPLYTHAAQHRRLFQNMLTLATVAAVILAAVGLVNRLGSQPVATQGSSPQPPLKVTNYSWSSVLIGLTMLSAAGMVKSLTFYNYDTTDGQFATLTSSDQIQARMNTDGISDNGQSLLYDETSPDQQKTYKMFSAATSVRSIYQMDARRGGNAIWMDATHILVQDLDGGVQELNVQTGVSQYAWPLKTGALAFYHQPFLYFVGAQEPGASVLYRADLTEAEPIPQQVAQSSLNAHFWISLDGATIFYADQNSSRAQGIYAVNSDGTDVRLLREGTGIPIGPTNDNALMVLEQVQERLQVVKLGVVPGLSQKVMLADAAPEAVSLCGPSSLEAVIRLCDQSIALAPDGHGLLLHAYYANGTNGLVYDNLALGSSTAIRSLPAGASVQLPGWFTTSPAVASTSQTAYLCA